MVRSCVYLVYEAGNFRPALDLCVALKKKGNLVPILFSPYYLPDTKKYIELSNAEGIPYVHEVTPLGGLADISSQLNIDTFHTTTLPDSSTVSLPNRITFVGNLRSKLASWVLAARNKEIGDWESYYLGRIEVAANFLASVDAVCLILPEDNVERDSACWCRAIHARAGVATVVSYGSITPHEAAIAYFDNSDYIATTSEDRQFLWLYPKWKLCFKSRTMLRLPTARAYAMERLGIAPKYPWVVNTGLSDHVVVESRFMRDQFIENGIPQEKILSLGTPSIDTLAHLNDVAHVMKHELVERQRWNKRKKIMLCALPPNQYPNRKSPEYDSFEELIDNWIKFLQLSSDVFNVIISPHPSIPQNYIDRIVANKFAITTDGAARWIPVCDVYLASVSSTIKWALACGKPVINYDCYHYRYKDYEKISSVLSVYAMEAAINAINKLKEPVYFDAIASRALESKEMFGQLDGLSSERILGLFNKEKLK